MKRIKIIAILIGILVFTSGAGLVYFANRYQNQTEEIETLAKELKDVEPERRKLDRENREFKSKYTNLLQEYEALKGDRQNVLLQTKRLLKEKGEYLGIEESLSDLQKEMKLLETEREEALEQAQAAQGEFRKLQSIHLDLEKEKDDYRKKYERIQKGIALKELQEKLSQIEEESKETASSLQKEYDALVRDFNDAEKELSKLQEDKNKKEARIKVLRDSLGEYKKRYDEAKKKNKGLTKELKDLPKKFTEVARQNKALLKDTSKMHYNLGVFYTNNNEYKRAITEFEKAIEINPEDTYAHFNLGYIYAEYLVDRKKAIAQFRHYLRLTKGDDQDVDWVKKYLLVWETYEGKTTMK
jgi:chromosome segregation ATPase